MQNQQRHFKHLEQYRAAANPLCGAAISKVERNSMQKKLWGEAPKLIYLQLVEKCNLRCKMCYEWGETGAYFEKTHLAQLDFGMIKDIVDACAPYKPHYWLYGGEPLMHPDIEKIIRYIKGAGSVVEMDSNGTLIGENAKMLIESGIDNIFVSLDGPRHINDLQRGQGVYDRVQNSIDTLYNLKQTLGATTPRISICTVATLDNHHDLQVFYFEHLGMHRVDQISLEMQYYLTATELEAYKDVLSEHFDIHDVRYANGALRDIAYFKDFDREGFLAQYDKIKAHCLANGILFNSYPRNMSKAVLDAYYDQPSRLANKRKCVYPWVFAEVTAKGDISPCHAYYDLTFGNLHDESILEIWNGEKYKAYREYMKHNKLHLCAACCHFYNEKKYTGK